MIPLKNFKSEGFKATFPDAVGEVVAINIRSKEMDHPETKAKVFRASATLQVYVDKVSFEDNGNPIDSVKKDFFLTAKERADLLDIVVPKVK